MWRKREETSHQPSGLEPSNDTRDRDILEQVNSCTNYQGIKKLITNYDAYEQYPVENFVILKKKRRTS